MTVGNGNMNGMSFSTSDNKNDNSPWYSNGCPATFRGGWWYNNCYLGYLNGINYKTQQQDEKTIFSKKNSLHSPGLEPMTHGSEARRHNQ